MAQLLTLYEEFRRDHPYLSLACFAREAGVPAWKLRDARQQAAQQAGREKRQQARLERIRQVALSHPTYGYRRLHQVMAASPAQEQPAPGQIGLHTIRLALGELGLQPPVPRKTRKKVVPAICETLWPSGRRIQVDATRFNLGDGICWAYLVLDVETRTLLHVSVVRSLAAGSAGTALHIGLKVLRGLGLREEVLVMTDGGSDFTSAAFQTACQEVGCWVRARVSQQGGMGVLERTNRTLKYEFVFREEFATMQELREGAVRFRDWYNQVRLHSALGYACPWAKLLETAKSRNAA
ncbi:integrase core domain-containing protein [Deinococcus sp. YIM 134068]|uniref:integrase core domain-containing protein n=1 Tax=Deinococcus lichenicola TaxID=3118910 RepID=UPI002F934AD8